MSSLVHPPSSAPPATPAGPLAALRSWYRQPTLTWWVLAALAIALALRKPDALLAPQLWAEDGSIFLLEQDQLGAAALITPYMGYLHTLPRLTAWLAAQVLDPAWWPACYNGVAFAIWLAVIARTFSPRLPLPHKPCLALAFIFGPHTGEILFNITNVQWIAAFALVQQAILARPQSWPQRLGDLAVVAVVGLTGPFVIALLPLLAWRWWRDRHGDNLTILLAAAACAAIQAAFIQQAAITFEHQRAPFDLVNGLAAVSRRLFVWPMFGPKVAHALPALVQGLLGAAVLLVLSVRALRPGPQRWLRSRLLAALALLLLAGFVRIRPDTWTADDLAFGDRYFFLPRLLLAWLIFLEFDATSRTLAWTARFLAIAMACIQLSAYTLPAPVNYRWAEHCDAIRRGLPAKIPILPEEWILEYPGRPAVAR